MDESATDVYDESEEPEDEEYDDDGPEDACHGFQPFRDRVWGDALVGRGSTPSPVASNERAQAAGRSVAGNAGFLCM